MKPIENLKELKIGSLFVSEDTYIYTQNLAQVVLVLGISKNDINKCLNEIQKQGLYFNTKQEFFDRVIQKIYVSYYTLGFFLYKNNKFITEKETYKFIKIQLDNVLSTKIDTNGIGTSSLNSIYKNNILLNEIQIESSIINNWLLKSYMLDKTIYKDYIEINDAIKYIKDKVYRDYGTNIDLLEQFNELSKNLFKGVQKDTNFRQGNLVIKETPKMLKFYIVLGHKNGMIYILKVDHILKSDIRPSVWSYRPNIVNAIKYAFRHNMAETVKSNVIFYDTNINFMPLYKELILEEFNRC